jgi:hypothetical protein
MYLIAKAVHLQISVLSVLMAIHYQDMVPAYQQCAMYKIVDHAA